MSTQAMAAPQTYEIDPEHFAIGFSVLHVGYADVLGMFLKATGSFVYDEETRELVSGRVVVDAASVFSNHGKRDDHLRKGDFLATRNHPEIVFEATGLEWENETRGKLSGDLTLLGKTRPLELTVKLNKAASYPFGHGKHTLGISATTTLLRSEWGMTYGIKGDLVADEVRMTFELEAIR
ncbi:MAG: YceI family protein [Zoogloeaceae bacterium]|nr:YceI family protein [Zoogloeaceae bacterium]